ncbi:MAG: nucleotide exchange factor GrpE [Gammaproteobacteria bacterium]
MSNPFKNEKLRKKPAEQKGKKRQSGDPLLKEKLEQEIEDLEELEEEGDAELCEELLEVKTELKESHDKLLLAHAELENVRRRAQKDIASAHKYALEKFVKDLLPVLDNFDLALVEAQKVKASAAMIKGIELTQQSLLKVMENYGVKQINPLNEMFDPQYHEAMTAVTNPEVKSNTIIDVFQKGYVLNGRLVRPARVVVSKA